MLAMLTAISKKKVKGKGGWSAVRIYVAILIWFYVHVKVVVVILKYSITPTAAYFDTGHRIKYNAMQFD